MNFVDIVSFDNYVDAHIAMGRLQEDDINCHLKDEHTVSIDPILTNAVGGIKLMVPEVQAERAIGILRELKNKHLAQTPCPECGSLNVDWVSSPRKLSNWASVLIGLFITRYAPAVEKVMHCFQCGNEYQPQAKTLEQ